MARSEPGGRAISVALDLGSSYIKGGLLDETGRLVDLRSVASPALRGAGAIREADPGEYVTSARRLVEALTASTPSGLPLGLTSQRSSFLLWNRRDGRPRTPLISWQDRRAAAWCEQNAAIESDVVRNSGLALSAHYAGPKLAAMRERDPSLGAEIDGGQLLFGNLDSYLLWRWTGGRRHETDLTMAARTSLVNLTQADWCDDLLRLFQVPASVLPTIAPSGGREIELASGLTLRATLADQSSSAVCVFAPSQSLALVNLGTGGFVLLPTCDAGLRRPGFLTAPILGAPDGRHRFALEGSINGAGASLDRFGDGPTPLPETDPTPEAFAIPDTAGLGSPHWRAGFELTLSPATRALARRDQRRIVLEGLLFRVREILEGLSPCGLPERILLSGGLASEPALAPGLASLLDHPVERLEQPEGTLLGVARLAAGLEPHTAFRSGTIEPDRSGGYLRSKFERWRRWFDTLLSAGSDP